MTFKIIYEEHYWRVYKRVLGFWVHQNQLLNFNYFTLENALIEVRKVYGSSATVLVENGDL